MKPPFTHPTLVHQEGAGDKWACGVFHALDGSDQHPGRPVTCPSCLGVIREWDEKRAATFEASLMDAIKRVYRLLEADKCAALAEVLTWGIEGSRLPMLFAILSAGDYEALERVMGRGWKAGHSRSFEAGRR